jgi:hypothetical protein
MAALFLSNETRRRKSIGLPTLTHYEQKKVLRDSGNLIRRSKTGMTFDNIKQSSRLLRIVARGVVVKSENELYDSALFAAQYSRVHTEVNLIKSAVKSTRNLSSRELETLEKPIAHLHHYLHQDTTWRHVIHHLGLVTESLVVVRRSVRSILNLHQHASLARKIKAVERLLLPTDGCEEDFAKTRAACGQRRSNYESSKLSLLKRKELIT